MDPIRHIVRVTAANMQVEVRINDVPVGWFSPGEAEFPAEVPINEFLIGGKNTLAVIMHANSLPSRVFESWTPNSQPLVTLACPANVEVVVEAVADDQVAAAALARVTWTGLAQAVPLKEEKLFDSKWKPPVWDWTRARQLNPAVDLDLAFQGLVQLHEILFRKDQATFSGLISRKLKELTVEAYGVSEAPLHAALTRGLVGCMSDPTWQLMPCGRPDVDLRIVGHRRLVECLRPDGRHALTYEKRGTGELFFIPVALGELDRVWQVLR